MEVWVRSIETAWSQRREKRPLDADSASGDTKSLAGCPFGEEEEEWGRRLLFIAVPAGPCQVVEFVFPAPKDRFDVVVVGGVGVSAVGTRVEAQEFNARHGAAIFGLALFPPPSEPFSLFCGIGPFGGLFPSDFGGGGRDLDASRRFGADERRMGRK